MVILHPTPGRERLLRDAPNFRAALIQLGSITPQTPRKRPAWGAAPRPASGHLINRLSPRERDPGSVPRVRGNPTPRGCRQRRRLPGGGAEPKLVDGVDDVVQTGELIGGQAAHVTHDL